MENGARIIGNCSRVGHYVRKSPSALTMWFWCTDPWFFFFFLSYMDAFGFFFSFLPPTTPHAQSLPPKTFFSRLNFCLHFLNFLSTFPFCFPPLLFSSVAIFLF
ncbi:hypothetical protein F5X96DRAFT_212163 [Biscogniauxia mediterranea]|nr:hypothetical protein F5X96DRAFT_212163 [Biscogniauxia mediterranea]